MKDQRWPGDYETIPQEFAHARMEEQRGMNDVNRSYGNDYLANNDATRLDAYQVDELEPSITTQLDRVGMQPHSREYLEYQMSCMRSDAKYDMVRRASVDVQPGIQFTDCP